MEYNSYIVQDTNLSLTMPLACPSPPKASHSKGLRISRKAKKFGFTLAEVLITLTIIGVVAAMTIPTLLMKHQKQEYVTRLKKVYSTLTNAMQMLPVERGCSGGDYVCAGYFSDFEALNFSPGTTIDGQTFTSATHTQTYLLSKVLKTQTICTGDATKCANFSSYNNVFGSNSNGQLLLEDGTAIAITDTAGSLVVDLNGAKGPNKTGRDIFFFELAPITRNNVMQGTVMPVGSDMLAKYNNNSSYWKNFSSKCGKVGEWEANFCAGRVLEEGKMDY